MMGDLNWTVRDGRDATRSLKMKGERNPDGSMLSMDEFGRVEIIGG